ncbi:hypothetical protein [Candidatus Pseudoruminococcus sp.]|jgi:hypothetical protein|uniref:hypothetical protein n=1 Tax=Candidatus Pseudoruminococcus sp. TaxID=3101048 RepID=UPI00399AE319
MENQPKRLLEKLLEAAIIFVIATYLIKLGVCYILCVWPVLVILATVVIGGVIAYRIWKRKHDSNW